MWMGKTGGWTALCKRVLQAPLRLRRTVHGEAGPGILEGAEEGQPENVVEVEVGQQGGGMQWGPQSPHLLVQHVAQRTQSRPQVDDEGLVPLDVDHEA